MMLVATNLMTKLVQNKDAYMLSAHVAGNIMLVVDAYQSEPRVVLVVLHLKVHVPIFPIRGR